MQMMSRLFELSNIDVSAQTAKRVDDKLMLSAMRATMDEVAKQQQQIQMLAQQQAAMQQPQQEDQRLTPPLQQGVPYEVTQGSMPANQQ